MDADSTMSHDQQTGTTVPDSPSSIKMRIFVALLALVIVAGGLVLLFAVWSLANFGTIPAGIGYLNGFAVWPDAFEVNLGQVPADSTVTHDFVIQNLTDEPVRILGAKTDCSCTVASGLPVTIGPSSSRSISLEVGVSAAVGEGGLFSHSAQLFLDHDSRPVVLTLSGTIVPQK